MQLGELSGPELVVELRAICGNECCLVAKSVACLVDVDRHKLYLKMASSSLYGFCVDKLGMSEGAAYRRINAARLVRRFPTLLPRIARGELHLSGLVLLRKYFTDENVEELAAEASGLPESKILELLARRAPRPAVPDRISAMPVQAQVPLPATALPAAQAQPQPRSRTEPLSSAAYLVQLTVSADTHAKLVEARNLLSHSVPDGNLPAVVDRALDALLDRLRRERLGTGTRPRRAKSDPGAVSCADRRAVFERDGGQCTYRSEDGERCPARSLLQTDHIVARSVGGRGDPSNLQLLCGPHNRLKAEEELGAAKVSAAKESRKRKSPPGGGARNTKKGRIAVHVDGNSVPPGSEVVPVSGGVAASPAGETTSDAEDASESSAAKAVESASGTDGAASGGVHGRKPRSVIANAKVEVSEDEARAVFGLASMGFSRPACERVVRGIRSRGGEDLELVAILREAIGTLSAQRA